MDIQHLVDRLEDLIDEGRHIPMTKMTMVDEERALEIIDQMRISVPEEIEKASRIINQRDRLMAQANEEAASSVMPWSRLRRTAPPTSSSRPARTLSPFARTRITMSSKYSTTLRRT
jgi:Flp pilus assembly CpaF family ATPase